MATKIKELVGKDLRDFKIVEMTEVYRVDDDGLKSSSLGFFKDPNIASAFAGVQKNASWHKTGQALVLTDGTIGYVIEDQNPVKLFDDEAEALDIKKKAVAKFSPEERKLLGYED
ncbi:MAG: hypothetical protein H6791_01955 [Candidatus Nomurabacteria bacterium]|nr:MAG: hypothetical protein H6791_01955 [Candidatus Nomurabacteria bacterium]